MISTKTGQNLKGCSEKKKSYSSFQCPEQIDKKKKKLICH